jgi:hypothetical protein
MVIIFMAALFAVWAGVKTQQARYCISVRISHLRVGPFHLAPIDRLERAQLPESDCSHFHYPIPPVHIH